MLFYSKSTGAFYDSAAHGTRTVLVPNPKWKRPKIEVVDPADEMLTIVIDDASAQPDLIEVENADCKLPKDAVEISSELHASLLLAQSEGKVIVAGKDGLPVAKARTFTPEEKKEIRSKEILSALFDIDNATPRAVREAIITGNNSRVVSLETQAASLRNELSTL